MTTVCVCVCYESRDMPHDGDMCLHVVRGCVCVCECGCMPYSKLFSQRFHVCALVSCLHPSVDVLYFVLLPFTALCVCACVYVCVFAPTLPRQPELCYGPYEVKLKM